MKKTTITKFRKLLLGWYDADARDLLWRRTRDPYRIWVSEVMLQQTQVATVTGYYSRFLDAFPDLPALAAAPLDPVLKCWQGLGYYSRARNFHRAAKQVMADHGGMIPSDPAVFRQLPGVGDYICAAVQSIAFNHPMAVVDGNVKRVMARLHKADAPVNRSGTLKAYQALADPLLDPARPGDYNQALMDLGAVVCRPAIPRCGKCPVQGMCRAFADQEVADFPKRIQTRKTPEVRKVCGIWCRGKALLFTRRPEKGLLAGLWELPGIEVETGETAVSALRRLSRAQFGTTPEQMTYLGEVRHTYTHFRLRLAVFRIFGPIDVSTADACQWADPKMLSGIAIHRAVEKALVLSNTESGCPEPD